MGLTITSGILPKKKKVRSDLLGLEWDFKEH